MKKEKRTKNFLDKPYFEGGNKAMSAFVDHHLQYPKEAKNEGISGTVVIKYTINYKGAVIETKVVSGIGYGCDEEAERVVRLLKFQVGTYRNMKVQFHKTIKIHFHTEKIKAAPLPKPTASPKSTGQSITYTVTPKKVIASKAQAPKKGSSYGYTITIPKG